MDNKIINKEPVIDKDAESATENKEELAVKPHHRLKPIDGERDGMFKVRNILNYIFIFLAVIGVAVWLFSPNKNIAIIIMLAGVVIKFIEASLRIFHK
nr:mechanosensitive ion channel protein MscS [Prevotella sp.]